MRHLFTLVSQSPRVALGAAPVAMPTPGIQSTVRPPSSRVEPEGDKPSARSQTSRPPSPQVCKTRGSVALWLLSKQGPWTYGLQRQEHWLSPPAPPRTQQWFCLMPLFIHQRCTLNWHQGCAGCQRELWFEQSVLQGRKDLPGHSHTHTQHDSTLWAEQRERTESQGLAWQTKREPQSTRQLRQECYKATLFSGLISLLKLRKRALWRWFLPAKRMLRTPQWKAREPSFLLMLMTANTSVYTDCFSRLSWKTGNDRSGMENMEHWDKCKLYMYSQKALEHHLPHTLNNVPVHHQTDALSYIRQGSPLCLSNHQVPFKNHTMLKGQMTQLSKLYGRNEREQKLGQ